MKARAFCQVDVFTDQPCLGNPLAVVIDGDGLDEALMQQFARWTNLSETVFLLPPTDAAADYRVRIFTPGGELPFAGHPTLGSCHAWLAAGGRPRGAVVVQQCGVGLVRVRQDDGRLAFEAPPLRRRPVEPSECAAVAAALGLKPGDILDAQWLDNGPVWLGLQLASADRVRALEPDHAVLKSLAKVGVIGAETAGAETQFEVRAFAAPLGVPEDPVTGSLNASLAEWLIDERKAPDRYIAAQGTRLGRAGRVHVLREDGRIWIGGASVTCIDGSVHL